MPSWLTKAEVRRGSMSTKVVFQEVLLIWISIAKTSDRKEPKISKEKTAASALNALQLTLWLH